MKLNKILTYAAAFVVAMIILLSGALVIMPQVEATVAARAETDRVDLENAAKDTRNALLAQEFSTMGALQDELAGLQSAIPIGSDAPTLLRQLNTIADAHGVTLDSISISEPLAAEVPVAAAEVVDPAVAAAADSAAPATGVLSIPVALSVSGGSDAILGFIGGLQTSDRIISVTAFSTSTGAATGETTDAAAGDAASVTATISAVVYGLPAS